MARLDIPHEIVVGYYKHDRIVNAIRRFAAVPHKMAEGRGGAIGFMEDSPKFAASKPKIEVHPLGIGGKEPPARLVFDAISGSAVAVCMTDMGDRFRLICANIELVFQPHPPVARLM